MRKTQEDVLKQECEKERLKEIRADRFTAHPEDFIVFKDIAESDAWGKAHGCKTVWYKKI